jgi:type IV pilus assembly protein PilX
MANPMKLPMNPRMQRPPRRQKGIVLLVALTVLVAMSLAGVALIRSVDNTVVIAGNLAFKQSSLQVADRGSLDAITWLVAQNAIVPPVLNNDNNGMGYYSARPPVEPDWFDDNTWAGAITTNGGLPDSSGNKVKYLIHRMCTVPGAAPGVGNQQCGLFFPPTVRQDTSSKAVGSFKYEGSHQLYYRVTTRVEGPRNNVTIVQTNVLI